MNDIGVKKVDFLQNILKDVTHFESSIDKAKNEMNSTSTNAVPLDANANISQNTQINSAIPPVSNNSALIDQMRLTLVYATNTQLLISIASTGKNVVSKLLQG
jgi:hypothetical protein